MHNIMLILVEYAYYSRSYYQELVHACTILQLVCIRRSMHIHYGNNNILLLAMHMQSIIIRAYAYSSQQQYSSKLTVSRSQRHEKVLYNSMHTATTLESGMYPYYSQSTLEYADTLDYELVVLLGLEYEYSAYQFVLQLECAYYAYSGSSMHTRVQYSSMHSQCYSRVWIVRFVYPYPDRE